MKEAQTSRVTRWVCEKVAQSVTQSTFRQIFRQMFVHKFTVEKSGPKILCPFRGQFLILPLGENF
jgi:hypothetical protein